MTDAGFPEAILVLDADVEVEPIDGEAGNAIGRAAASAGDDASKKALRDQLRRTLSKKESLSDVTSRRNRRGNKSLDIQETYYAADVFPPRQYFVLTDAGKPVFTSRTIEHNADDLASTMGIMQALISVFLDEGDKLRCINAGGTRISFLIRSPLYYACVSSWGEPESVTRSHLEYLHLQVLSIVTMTQLRRIFERRTNFDLGRLLGGAEVLIHSLLDRVEVDPAMSTSSLQCLKLDPVVRARAANALVPSGKMKASDILYIILVAQGRVITLVRPKKHSIHPADLHILMNTAHSPSIINSSASASWLPLCLPKFNSSGFVNTFVTYLQPEDDISDRQSAGKISEEVDNQKSVDPASSRKASTTSVRSGVGLLCVTGSGDFEMIRSWCDTVSKRLDTDGTLAAITQAISGGSTEYSVSDLSIPGLRHFIYKSRAHVQITAPVYEEPYDNITERRRLITLYQTLHDGIHAKSGQDLPLKLQYIRTEKESVMGWITQPFEIYITLSHWLPKSAAVNAANAVSRWVKKEEARLFLRDAPVF
ncbi:DUF254-domain-containing protein [Auriscalpium vulgare]|uniref:DUF254-domain-containing protein n=1 Tax=Auriscalpium vulgare TaxID=40419 RepID=A0ACB8R7D2_9AGAM|nr:DUF254-domain-containing protein [Auriscalpium vulgare]